jgi:glycosyltransferase involved in cell wall biosynthesis
MKVLLISSGCGEWPNNGWGACENLTADFCWALQQSGVDAQVIHSSTLQKDLIEKITSWMPDIVHCEYDDHILELQMVLNRFPSIKVIITTHYAFLSQSYKLIQDGYMYRFLMTSQLAKHSGLILAPLSQEIAYVYTDIGGVPSEKMWIFPNGTRVDAIRCSEVPLYQDKAVCLGKIEDRKNQHLLQTIQSLDFIGPVCDDRFDATRVNYKGKWTRDELYEKLTDYSCLVLFSKAEAHPLVIGEALAAGCAIVCNQVAAANLPVEMPWICVVNDDMIKDSSKMEKVISNMCSIGIKHRKEIRAWAETNLDWRIRAKTYIDKWGTGLMKKPDLQLQEVVQTNVNINPLRIALVGPGIMAIPPPGWGAVEQLIWDYSCFLKKQGHTVDIINTPHRPEIIAKVGLGNYDVAHVHYDVFWDIADRLDAKVVCITSHYPYIDKQEKWKQDGYDTVFEGICSASKKGVKLFALSQKDRDMYLNVGGLHPSNVFMMPNGVNTDSFRFSELPHFQKRSVILAKVEPRKRQHLTFELDQVDYIGRGPCEHPNYRGEIEPRELLMNILTDWGTFVLLSDGENGTPLVVKEAMAAGLGCVLSQTAAYELPKNLGWVQVVPECDLSDPKKINDAIEMNRALSLPMRKQIREWVRSNWDWSGLVAQYVVNLKSCLEKCC